MGNHQRHFQRRPPRIPVQIPLSHSTLPMFTDSQIMNISRGGIFLRSDITLPLGSTVDFEFTLPHSDQKVKATGVVVWSRSRQAKKRGAFPDHPVGMGIQFKEIHAQDFDSLLDEIERLMRQP